MLQLSDYIAGVAAILAAISAFYAYRATAHAKTQADAAIGNLPPDVEMRVQAKGSEFGRSLDVTVRNHNRETVYVLGFDFEGPDGLNFMHKPGPNADLSPSTRKTILPFAVPVPPLAGENRPSMFKFVVVPNKAHEIPEEFDLKCTVRFRVGNARREIKRTCFQTVKR